MASETSRASGPGGTGGQGPFDQVDPSAYHRSRSEESLPDVLPSEPMGLVASWYDEAHRKRVQPNPNAMTLATLDPDGTISARVVLCKRLDAAAGLVVFYTNYLGRKGRALEAHPRAAAVFHWDTLDRQVRLEGPVVKSPASESDAYFASRPWESRIGAWASDQSQPVASRDELHARVRAAMERFGLPPGGPAPGVSVTIPRPEHWGGFRLFARRVELWVAGTGRVHDRAEWVRELRPEGPHSFTGGPWRATRLQP